MTRYRGRDYLREPESELGSHIRGLLEEADGLDPDSSRFRQIREEMDRSHQELGRIVYRDPPGSYRSSRAREEKHTIPPKPLTNEETLAAISNLIDNMNGRLDRLAKRRG